MDCTQGEAAFPGDIGVKAENQRAMIRDIPLDAHDIMPIVKKEEALCEGDGSSHYIESKVSSDFPNMVPSSSGFQVVVKTEPAADSRALTNSSSNRCDSENTPPDSDSSLTTTSTESDNAEISCSKKPKAAKSKSNGKTLSMKSKKKTQWPRSMNRANLLAFRQRILDKLKKGQEIANDPLTQTIPLSVMTSENPSSILSSSSSSSSVPPLIKCEASSLNSEFEVQVMYERNHMTTKRCQSEPANSQSFLLPLHISNSDGHLNNSNVEDELVSSPCLFDEEKFFGMPPEDADNILNNFNPDVLLSSHLVDMMLDGMGFKFDVTKKEERSGKKSQSIADTEIDKLVSNSENGSFSSSSFLHSLSLGDRPSDKDIDHLLAESGDCESISPLSSSSSLGSPDLTPVPPTDQFDLGITCSFSPAGSISRSVSLDGCSSPSYQKNRGGQIERKRCFSCDMPCVNGAIDDDHNSAFLFPEILSVEGSMVLDGVGVISEGGVECDSYFNHHVRDAFLHSTHDPLLASDTLSHSI